jgi:hypothetical protein
LAYQSVVVAGTEGGIAGNRPSGPVHLRGVSGYEDLGEVLRVGPEIVRYGPDNGHHGESTADFPHPGQDGRDDLALPGLRIEPSFPYYDGDGGRQLFVERGGVQDSHRPGHQIGTEVRPKPAGEAARRAGAGTPVGLRG